MSAMCMFWIMQDRLEEFVIGFSTSHHLEIIICVLCANVSVGTCCIRSIVHHICPISPPQTSHPEFSSDQQVYLSPRTDGNPARSSANAVSCMPDLKARNTLPREVKCLTDVNTFVRKLNPTSACIFEYHIVSNKR